MSGHSKWSKIKRAKESTDAQRSKVFTKLGREISVAVKEGGTDPNTNNRLRLAIAKAKQSNMPSDRINAVLKKPNVETVYFEQVYEGYGIGGVAVMVKALTDNKNRTAGDVRHYFDKYGGSLGSTGCVSYMFEQKGVIAIDKTSDFDEELVIDTAIESGALDYEDDGDVFIIYTAPEMYSIPAERLKSVCTVLSSENEMVPNSYITLSVEQRVIFDKLVEMFEDNDDIQNIYYNIEG